MDILTKAFRKCLRLARLDSVLLVASRDSYLYKTGWLSSSLRKQCLDSQGEPIPWWTFAAIRFMDDKIGSNKSLDVFEFGAGYSTLWLSNRARSVRSVENNKGWLNLLQKRAGENVELIYSDTGSRSYGEITFLPLGDETLDYSKEILKDKRYYDLIVVDGVDRNNCVKTALERIKPEGVIIIDNLELKDSMLEALALLKERQFRSIELWGLSAGVSHETGTAVYYRKENCLGI